MVVKGSAGLLLVHIGVAVHTAVRAGVIRSDVRAFRAAAFFSCGFLFVLEAIGEKQALNNIAVDAMGFIDVII